MDEETYTQIMYGETDLEVLSGVGSPALLSLLSTVDGLNSVQHQILQLQCFHQVSVPNNAWRRRGEEGKKKNEETYCI